MGQIKKVGKRLSFFVNADERQNFGKRAIVILVPLFRIMPDCCAAGCASPHVCMAIGTELFQLPTSPTSLELKGTHVCLVLPESADACVLVETICTLHATCALPVAEAALHASPSNLKAHLLNYVMETAHSCRPMAGLSLADTAMVLAGLATSGDCKQSCAAHGKLKWLLGHAEFRAALS